MQFYRGTQTNVQAFIDAVNGNPIFPIVKPNGYRMEKWCDDAQLCIDGKYCCPKIPTKILDNFNVPQEERDNVIANYVTNKLTEEEYNNSWFSEEEE